MPRSSHIHKSMLLRGVKFGPSALDRSDIETTKSRASQSGRSHGGAPLRGGYGNGRGRGQINYSDSRPNPFAAHLASGFSPFNPSDNHRGPPPPPFAPGWIPPPPGSDAFMRGPPPPPTAGFSHGNPPPAQGYPYALPPQAHQSYQQGGQYNGGYVNNRPGGDGYRGPHQQGELGYNGNHGRYQRY